MEENKNPQRLSTILQNMTISANRRNGIYIHGSAGCGKSTIARGLYKQLCDWGSAEWFECPELMLKFRECFKNDNGKSESQILKEMTEYYHKIIFIDDFGAEKNSEYTDETMYLLLNRIDNRNIIPIITSNYSLKEIAKTMSDRIASRIAGMCDIVEIKDKDYRLSEKHAFIENEKNKKAIELCQKLIDWSKKQ